MTEILIFEMLRSLVDDKVYPLIAIEEVIPPYIVYTPISDVHKDVFCGIAESTKTIQIDVYHQIYDEMLELKKILLTD